MTEVADVVDTVVENPVIDDNIFKVVEIVEELLEVAVAVDEVVENTEDDENEDVWASF